MHLCLERDWELSDPSTLTHTCTYMCIIYISGPAQFMARVLTAEQELACFPMVVSPQHYSELRLRDQFTRTVALCHQCISAEVRWWTGLHQVTRIRIHSLYPTPTLISSKMSNLISLYLSSHIQKKHTSWFSVIQTHCKVLRQQIQHVKHNWTLISAAAFRCFCSIIKEKRN